MIYTLENLYKVLELPINKGKWGRETREVVQIISSIRSADCSSCMFRRKIARLREILTKYGDDIANPYETVVKLSKNKRISCPDCVDKHINQAWVLQNELYQGYTDNLGLIESHLAEAIEECPETSKELLFLLNECLKRLQVDGDPKIPVILAYDMLKPHVSTKNIDQKCQKLDTIVIKTLIEGIPSDILARLMDILSPIPGLSQYPEPLRHAEWVGRMALASDILSNISPQLAKDLRRRRLFTPDSDIFNACDDIMEVIDGQLSHNPDGSQSIH